MLRELPHILKPIENPELGDCSCCNNSVSGKPVYECSSCRFFIHKPCLKVIEKTKMEIEHELSKSHHFFETRLHDDDEIKADCLMCKEILLYLSGKNAPTIYKCFIPNCNCFIHKSCAEAPKEMHADHLHDHCLILKPPTETRHHCDACGKHFRQCFFYECNTCEYETDIKCTSRWKVSPSECNPHTLIPIGISIEFTCQVCGEKRSDMGSICSNCRFLIHSNCVRFPRIIQVRGHIHFLTITQPLSRHKCQVSHLCQVCREVIHKDHGAYCCEQACGFIAHLWCAYFDEVQSGTGGSASYRALLVEEENKEHIGEEKLLSSLHGHELILMKDQLEGRSCAGCMQHILLPQFYGCHKCSFFVHVKCARVPAEINRPVIHRHQLRLHTPFHHFWCWECDCFRNGFFYACDECSWYKLDIQCALMPGAFKHKLHQHHLFRGNLQEELKCCACGEYPWGIRSFKCKTCNFPMCINCVTLPLVAK